MKPTPEIKIPSNNNPTSENLGKSTWNPFRFRRIPRAVCIATFLLALAFTPNAPGNSKVLDLKLRGLSKPGKAEGAWQRHLVEEHWEAKRTALVICDMWDYHHSHNATKRVGEMAPRMNKVVSEMRRRGALVVHAPSDCMDSYKDHPARKRAMSAPVAANLPKDITGSCEQIPGEEMDYYPIDQSDGGDDDDPLIHQKWANHLKSIDRNPRSPWKRQIDAIDIDGGKDIISDKGDEIWNAMEARGIENVILVGVHTNMCVLGRPFGLRQMAKNGRNVALMRDMTDTMYNPARKPYVSHYRGTDLIVEHIEKYVAGTITSDQVIGGEPFKFKWDVPTKVVIAIAEPEYKTWETLPALAEKIWTEDRGFEVKVVIGDPNKHTLPGLADALKDADVLVLSARRQALPKDQLDAVRAFLASGKGLLAIRTSSHAFFARGKGPEGHAEWPEFDAEVLGGNYVGHYGGKEIPQITVAKGAEKRPILDGVNLPHISNGSLYKAKPIATDAAPLLIGTIVGKDPEPVAWTRVYGSSKIFYTSLGHVSDFEQPGFQKLIWNAMEWVCTLPSDAHLKNAGNAVVEPSKKTSSAPGAKPPEESLLTLKPGAGLAIDLAVADHEGWTALPVPNATGWETGADGEFANHDGFAWYRAYVKIPKEWQGSRLLLIAGSIDNVDEGFFNGQRLGANGSMPPLYNNPASPIRRPFVIEPDLVRFGEVNLIAWRIYDKDGKGGIIEGPIHLTRAEDAIDLSGQWLFHTGDAPAWASWWHDPGSADGKLEAEAFFNLAGAKHAGHRGLVAADIAYRERMIAAVYKRFEGNNNPFAKNDDKGDPKSPEDSLATLKIADGLAVDNVLAEPVITQPLYVDFDERGRIWVSEYIQYPNPAGLKVLTWDAHLRKVFDQVPPPPPYQKPEQRKFLGRDKLSIHEDTDGDGNYDKHSVFVDGLNLVTSSTRGRGGVWVMHPPYLLFYPDADNDDVPDSDPVVHLSGFGLEDTHSIANSLKWGPDGWLYGATGSTVTARVRAHLSASDKRTAFMGQAIWRYHPESHLFELFAEGGWNTFGVDFDDQGRVYSGTNGNLQAVYFVQDGFYQKGFGKHGPHTNPYAFGYFGGLPIKGENVRIVHQWIHYNSGAIPSLEGLLVGGNSLASKVHALRMEPDGSSFKTVEAANPIKTDHKWFRPVHCTAGPDGAIYFSDFYDARITHVDPRDNWDRERGRIIRLRAADAKPGKAPDLSKKTSLELVKLLADRNQWVRRTAQRLLADRRDKSVQPDLITGLVSPAGQLALESLWALNGIGEFTDAVAQKGMKHADPHVRAWAVRLLGDPRATLPFETYEVMSALAENENHPVVISQLASTAQRLPVPQALPIIGALTSRDAFASDSFIPQQIWWALESAIGRDAKSALTLLDQAEFWNHAIFTQVLAERIGRRFMADRNDANMTICAQLLERAPNADTVKHLLRGMELALQGMAIDSVPAEFDAVFSRLWKKYPSDQQLISFALRLNSQEALKVARATIIDTSRPEAERVGYIEKLSQMGDADAELALLKLVGLPAKDVSARLRMAALNALRRYSGNGIPATLLGAYDSMEPDLRQTAQSILSGRPSWATQLLEAVDAGKVARESVTFDALLLIQSRGDEKVKAIIKKHWGSLRKPAKEKAGRIDAIKKLLAGDGARGDVARGRTLYTASCAACHKLGDLGRDIAPELTGYERGNLDFLLPAIVDPNLGVREEYELVTLTLRQDDGAEAAETTALTGFVSDATDQTVTLKDLVGNKTLIAKRDIADQSRAAISVMPEGLLDALTDQQIRDLFAFLQLKDATKK